MISGFKDVRDKTKRQHELLLSRSLKTPFSKSRFNGRKPAEVQKQESEVSGVDQAMQATNSLLDGGSENLLDYSIVDDL